MLRKRTASKKKASEWSLRTILLESMFIVMAVLLALWLNNWNTQRHNQKLVEQILESARQEISENLETISRTVEYRGQLLDEIRSGRRVMSRIDNFTEQTGIDFSDKKAITRFIDDILLREGALDQVGSELHPAPEGGYWMLFMGHPVRIAMDDSDLVVYGRGNIQLQPAYLSDVVWTTANAANVLIHMDFTTLGLLADIYSTQQSYRELSQLTVQLLYSQTHPQPAIEDMYWFENDLKEKYKAFLDAF